MHLGDRQGKPRALQQARAIAQVREWGDARVHAAGEPVFGLQEGGAQRGQGAEDGDAGDEQAAWPERAAKLDEGAGQIVDPVQGQVRDDEVEAAVGEWQGFAVHREGRAAGDGGHGGRNIGGDDGHAAPLQGGRDAAAAAEIERGLEGCRGILQPVQQRFGELVQDRRHEVDGASRPPAVLANGGGVENIRVSQAVNLFSAFKPVGLAVLDTLLPPCCLACDAPVAADGQFCLPCFRGANFVSAPFCGSCGVPLPFGAVASAAGICGVCEAFPPAFSTARAALRYDEMAKRLILPLKYADRTDLARGLAWLMARAGAKLLERADVLAPVPLHVTRLRQRRYNQAALLAGELGRMAGRPVLQDALRRLRPTVPLGKLGVAERRAELTGTMAVRRDVMGLAVLLVDDVMTSGTTADACAAVLRDAGATRVDVLTAARVPDPRLS